MGKNIFCALVAAAVLTPAVQAAPIIYGKANVSLQYSDKTSGTDTELVSNASRIGVKGRESVADGITAIYHFEYGTRIDDGGNGATFTQRNIYVGLQSRAGTLMAGKFDTPTKKSQGKIDLFDNLIGDLKHVFAGENRVSNIVQYITPSSLGPVTGKLALVLDENGSNGGNDGVSASAAYSKDALYVAVGMDQDIKATDVYRLATAYQLGAVQLGGAYQRTHMDNGDSGDGFFGSIKWRLTTHWVVKTQYAKSQIEQNDRQSASVGADYIFTRTVKAFTYYSQNKQDLGDDGDYLGAGLEVKF